MKTQIQYDQYQEYFSKLETAIDNNLDIEVSLTQLSDYMLFNEYFEIHIQKTLQDSFISWIGSGDISLEENIFKIIIMFFKKKNETFYESIVNNFPIDKVNLNLIVMFFENELKRHTQQKSDTDVFGKKFEEECPQSFKDIPLLKKYPLECLLDYFFLKGKKASNFLKFGQKINKSQIGHLKIFSLVCSFYEGACAENRQYWLQTLVHTLTLVQKNHMKERICILDPKIFKFFIESCACFSPVVHPLFQKRFDEDNDCVTIINDNKNMDQIVTRNFFKTTLSSPLNKTTLVRNVHSNRTVMSKLFKNRGYKFHVLPEFFDAYFE